MYKYLNIKKLNRMVRIFLAILFCVSGMTMVKAQPLTGPGVDPNALLLFDFEDGNVSGWRTGSAGR